MSLLNNIFSRSSVNKKGSEGLPVNSPEFKNFLSLYDLEVIDVANYDNKKSVVLVPKGTKRFPDTNPLGYLNNALNSPTGFSQYWMEQAWSKHEADVEHFREQRYEYYRFMDLNSTESSLMLDTYADESVATSDISESPIRIEINDKEAKNKVFDILYKNEILTSKDGDTVSAHRANIRELAKFGDIFIRYYRDKPKSENIRLQFLNYEIYKVKLIREPVSGKLVAWQLGNKDIVLPPWELVHGKIKDTTFDPYGRSILEPVRSAYQQLLITEALLALSRASRIERIVIKVPTTNKNPMAAFQSLLNIKSTLKSVIFGNNNNADSKSRIPALTDMLFMPSGEGYELDRLQSSIDVSSIEDVEFFRDKFITGTRLPKSYFLADETIQLDGTSLAQQDLKFARALLPLQDGYVDFLTSIITNLLILLNYDLSKVKVNVSMSRPQVMNSDMISKADSSIRLVESLLNNYGQFAAPDKPDTGDKDDSGFGGRGGDSQGAKIEPDDWINIVNKLSGVPISILNVIKNSNSRRMSSETSTTKEHIAESVVCSSSSDKYLSSIGYTHESLKSYQMKDRAVLKSELSESNANLLIIESRSAKVRSNKLNTNKEKTGQY